MSENTAMQTNQNRNGDALLKIFEQNCLHARHVEMLRLRFGTIYIISVGVILGLVESSILKEVNFLLIFLFVFSISGIMVTYRQQKSFLNQVRHARLAARELGVDEYLGLGKLMEKERPIWSHLRPWQYYILYVFVMLFCVFLLLGRPFL